MCVCSIYPWIQFPNKVLARVLRGEIGGYTFNFLNFQAKNVCIGRYITECWYVLYILEYTPGGNSGHSSLGQSKKLLFDSWAKIGRRTSIMVFSVSFNIFLLQLKIA